MIYNLNRGNTMTYGLAFHSREWGHRETSPTETTPLANGARDAVPITSTIICQVLLHTTLFDDEDDLLDVS